MNEDETAALAPEILPPPSADPAVHAERISIAWQKILGAILETGRLLIEAKQQVSHGRWQEVAENLPFSQRTAQDLMRIAGDKRLANPQHAALLPPAWTTLAALARLDDGDFSEAVADGRIHPEMQRRDVKKTQVPQRPLPIPRRVFRPKTSSLSLGRARRRKSN